MPKIDLDTKLNYEIEYSKYLKNIKMRGNSIQANCPFHKNGNERKQSFSVDLKAGKFKCFTCGKEGNYIDFIAEQYNISTKEAAKKIYTEHNLINETQRKVETNYTLEQYANEKTLPIGWLKEEWGLSNTKTSVTIPYYDENKKVVRTRLRGTNKKFRWGKGTKTLLYGWHKFKEIKEKGYVVLVEGESDTQTLWLNDIATLGSPGATNFNSAWDNLIYEIPNIYIHQENDFGGEEFVKQICRSLQQHDYKGNVYKIACSNKGQKDPSDLYKSNPKEFSENWKSIIENKIEINISVYADNIEKVIPDMPIALRPADGWKLNEDGIYQMMPKTGEFIRICRTPVILVNRLKSTLSQEEKIEIGFYRDKHWETAIYPRSVIFQARSITILADIGITVTSENAKLLVKYLQSIEETNMDLMAIKKTVNQLGWHGQNFMPFIKGNLVLDIDRSMYKLVSGYTSKGSLEEWEISMCRYRKNKIFRFLQNMSFASPLLRKLNLRNFVVHNYADTRSGKTAAMKANGSVWGYSQKLTLNFNATQVGIERTAGFFSDLPLLIDEKQLQGNNQPFLDSLIYMLGNGTSKVRGSKDGGIQAQSYWNSIILTTGEEPLIRTNSQGGITSRVLEIEGKPFDNEDDASKMYSLAEQNYGVSGPKFIEKLIEEFGSNYSDLKKEYNSICEQLLKDVTGKSRAYAGYIALEIVTDRLVNKYIFDNQTSEDSYSNGLEIYKSLPNEKDTNLIEKFYEFAESWVLSNHHSFDTYNYQYNCMQTHNSSRERYGIYVDNVEKFKYKGRLKDSSIPDRVYQIFPSIFQNVLLKEFNKDGHDLNYRDVIKKLADRGYILQEGNRNQIRVRYNNSNIRVIGFIPGKKLAKEDEEEQVQQSIDDLQEIYPDLIVIDD